MSHEEIQQSVLESTAPQTTLVDNQALGFLLEKPFTMVMLEGAQDNIAAVNAYAFYCQDSVTRRALT